MIGTLPERTVVEFDDWFTSEWTRLVAFGLALTGDAGAAEDLAQDACTAVYRQWDEIDNPDGYARRAMTNRSASRWRRKDREQRALRLVHATHEDRVEMLPSTADFWSAVRELPPPQGDVVTLHYLEDRSVAEIASLLGIADGSVKSALHRGRKALAVRLGHFKEEA